MRNAFLVDLVVHSKTIRRAEALDQVNVCGLNEFVYILNCLSGDITVVLDNELDIATTENIK